MPSTTLTLVLTAIACAVAQGYEITRAGYLPTARGYTASIYDGHDSVYIVGGLLQTQAEGAVAYNDLLRYNLTSEVVSKVASLPVELHGGALGTDGVGNFYHFGGSDLSFANNHGLKTVELGQILSDLKDVYRFSTASPTPVEVADLSFPVALHSAVSDQHGTIYLLGWQGAPTEVPKYDTATGVSQVIGNLPNVFQSGAAAYYEEAIYRFGGANFDTPGVPSYSIFKFSPEDGTTETLDSTLPNGAQFSGAVVVGTDIYVVGGIHDSNDFVFVRLNTVTQTVESLEVANFNLELLTTSATYVESLHRIYIFGGSGQMIFDNYDDIYYIQL